MNNPINNKMILIDNDMSTESFEKLCKKMDATPATKTVKGHPNADVGYIVTYVYQGTKLVIAHINMNRTTYIVQARDGLLMRK